MDKEEFSRLAQKYKGKMYGIAFQIVRNEADAWDAVSEGVLRAYESRNKLRRKEKFSSWIFQIVKNEAINILRVRKKDEDIWERMVQTLPGEDRQKKELNIVVEELPDDCREEIVLFYYNGLTLQEIADLNHIPLGTVKSRLHRGKTILRRRFQVEPETLIGDQKIYEDLL